MNALSYRQPWGWAITHADPAISKLLENRVWRSLKSGMPPSNMPLHTDFAIHVSATKPNDYDIDGVINALDLEELSDRDPVSNLRSAILGVAQIHMVIRCVEALTIVDGTSGKPSFPHYVIRPSDRDKFLYDLDLPLTTEQRHDQLRRWWLGPYAFVLKKVRKLSEPILEVKGALNFWKVPDALEAQIKERL